MSAIFFARTAASFFADGSVAVLSGLLLASRWLSRAKALHSAAPDPFNPVARPFLPLSAGILFLAQCLQLLLLTLEFSGAFTLREALPLLPDVLTTHAGSLAATLVLACLLLFFVSLLPQRTPRAYGCAALLCVVLALRSATGHAAVGGSFSLAELLQFLHLAGMAAWSGSVMVSGLVVVPRLQSAATEVNAGAYLRELSRAATVAVALVFVSGLPKTYRAADGSLGLLLAVPWGYVLLTKLLLVLLALCLGGLNRRWIHASSSWPGTALRKAAVALRVEAWCMTAVIALSATLGNLSPPGRP